MGGAHPHGNAQIKLTKYEILQRIRILLENVKRMTRASEFIGDDVEDLEALIKEIENDYAAITDDYMAGVINRYNLFKDNARRKRNAS